MCAARRDAGVGRDGEGHLDASVACQLGSICSELKGVHGASWVEKLYTAAAQVSKSEQLPSAVTQCDLSGSACAFICDCFFGIWGHQAQTLDLCMNGVLSCAGCCSGSWGGASGHNLTVDAWADLTQGQALPQASGQAEASLDS